ncbi:VWA domain-containing protein [Candidatus Gracilibacteria bacterium]|nr:VWA domain-containing protein [Candidatus Gracilibacteria bacterium]
MQNLLNIFFQDKIFLALFLLIPIIFFLYFKKNIGDEKKSIKISFFNSAKKFFSPQTKIEKIFYFWKKNFSIILKIFLLIILTIIIARPQLQSVLIEKKYSGIDVVLAVDVSLSMLAEDMKPNRITVAKNTILDFIDRLRTGDRMSLVIFSGRPFTNIPLTGDLKILRDFTEFLSTDLINQNVIGLNGTGLGNALLYSIDKFEKKGPGKDREKVLILMTDGENNRGINPFDPVKLAIDKGIKVYTIGIGKREGAEIPLILQNGEKGFIKNPDGSKYMTSLDEHTLIQIAQQTGGKYFWSDKKDTLKNIFKEIYSLEKKEIIFENKKKFDDIFENFAIFGFFIFLIYFIFEFWIFRRKI